MPQKLSAADFPTSGVYEIHSAADSRFLLDERHCTETDIADPAVQMFRPLHVKQQEYYLEFVNPYCCRIVNYNSGRYLAQGEVSVKTVSDSSGEPSGEYLTAPVNLVRYRLREEAEKDKSLLWHLTSRPDGSYLLRSADRLYLTLEEGRAFNMAGLSLREFSGKDDQQWTITGAPVYSGSSADTDFVNPYGEDGRLSDVEVHIAFQQKQEILTGEKLSSWMIPTDNHTFELDEDKLREYVSSLAGRYNTVGKPRRFLSHYQTQITLFQGSFGWKMDEDKTFEILKEAIRMPGKSRIKPAWAREGKDFYGTNSDIGDSYVEIDLTAQKVWLYKNGKLLLETDCVSGNAAAGRETPGGVYSIYYKQSPAVLTGADYSSPVDFWMPFNGGIGLHDANWRSTFGGEIYRTNGSHGCVNLPAEAAKIMYETVEIGWPVVCYR